MNDVATLLCRSAGSCGQRPRQRAEPHTHTHTQTHMWGARVCLSLLLVLSIDVVVVVCFSALPCLLCFLLANQMGRGLNRLLRFFFPRCLSCSAAASAGVAVASLLLRLFLWHLCARVCVCVCFGFGFGFYYGNYRKLRATCVIVSAFFWPLSELFFFLAVWSGAQRREGEASVKEEEIRLIIENFGIFFY